MFSDFADEYLASPIHAQKKQSRQASERVILEYWKALSWAAPASIESPR